jgi:hypothetical protein
MLTEVALEAHRLDPRVTRVESLDSRPGAVARAVVHDDHLKGVRVALEDLDGLGDDLLYGSLLVEDGHDEGDVRAIVLRKIG